MIRYEHTPEGRLVIVAPCTLIVEGVLNGSKGPLFYPLSEIKKSLKLWERIPLVVNHPLQNGKPLSARIPSVLDAYAIGWVANARIKGNRLIADGYFDVGWTKRVDGRVYDALMQGKPIELSTGLMTENVKVNPSITADGKHYDQIATNYLPDHLAVLPDQIGACSLKDGCGVLMAA